MKKTQIIKILCTMLLITTATGCGERGKDNNKVTKQEPGGSITIIDNKGNDDSEVSEPGISIIKIDNYEKIEISDWLDTDTVIVSKENESLDKMKLEELSDYYPKSLYLYNLNTKEYTLLTEQAELNLGGAKLSPDKKNLLYYGNSLGDPTYYILNLASMKDFRITGEEVGNVGSANWSDSDTVIGAGYMSGAYSADTEGNITLLEEFNQKMVYIIKKINDMIYYNTADDTTLMALNLSTRESVSLGLSDVSQLELSPDGNQILVSQYSGSKQLLLLCDKDGSNVKTIAEGVELAGISWSPDQRMIAYSMKGDGDTTIVGGLYLYDMLTGKSTQIAVNVNHVTTCWNPSGDKLVYAQWDGKQFSSSIVSLEYSLNK